MIVKRSYPLLFDGLERVEYISDSGFMIKNVITGEVFSSAVELTDTKVEYEETDIPIVNAEFV